LDRGKRELIMQAALDVVAETGFAAANMDVIAKRSGASKATLYRHWPDKSSLLIDAVERRSSLPVLDGEHDRFEEAVMAALQVSTRWARDNAGLFTAIVHAGHHDARLAQQTQQQIAAPHDALWDALADRWLETDRPRAWLRQVCEGLVLQQLLPDAQPPTVEVLRAFVTDVVAPLYETHRRHP
jgi:AcrR family transcriptional regulator